MSSLVVGFIAVLAATLGLGLYVGAKVKSVDDYYVMKRQGNVFLIAGTFFATIVSGAAAVGGFGLCYKYGLVIYTWGWGAVWGMALAVLLVAAPTRRYAERYNALTLVDFFRDRYDSKALATLASVVSVLGLMGYFTAQVMGLGTVVQSMTGLPYWTVIVLSGLVILLMTYMGGMRSVIVTDTLAMVVFVLAVLCYPLFVMPRVGGWQAFITGIKQANPVYWSWNAGGAFTTGAVFGGLFGAWVFGHAAGPWTVSRGFAAKDIKTWLSAALVGMTVLTVAIWLLEPTAGALYLLNPDIKKLDAVVVFLVKEVLPPGIGALAIGGITAGIISTADTQLPIMAQNITRDIWQRSVDPGLAEAKLLFWTRVAVAVLCAVGMALAFLPAETMFWVALFGAGMLGSGYFVPLVLGLHWRRANKTAAFVSMAVGTSVYLVSTIAPRMKVTIPLHPVIWGVTGALASFLVVALCTKPSSKEIQVFEDICRPRVEEITVSGRDYYVPILCMAVAILQFAILAFFLRRVL